MGVGGSRLAPTKCGHPRSSIPAADRAWRRGVEGKPLALGPRKEANSLSRGKSLHLLRVSNTAGCTRNCGLKALSETPKPSMQANWTQFIPKHLKLYVVQSEWQ